MPKIAGDPLVKTTLNLFEADVDWFIKRYGQGWSTQLRELVHRIVQDQKHNVLGGGYEQRD